MLPYINAISRDCTSKLEFLGSPETLLSPADDSRDFKRVKVLVYGFLPLVDLL